MKGGGPGGDQKSYTVIEPFFINQDSISIPLANRIFHLLGKVEIDDVCPRAPRNCLFALNIFDQTLMDLVAHAIFEILMTPRNFYFLYLT